MMITGIQQLGACPKLTSHAQSSPVQSPAQSIPAVWPRDRRRVHRLNAVSFSPTPVVSYVPVLDRVTASAPATIANLGPGFDWLGCAVEGDGDQVTAVALPSRPGEVIIDAIEGDGGRLPLEAARNCAGIAAQQVLKLMGPMPCGVALTIHKGLPLGSGMGSSAASAAAGAWAVNALFGEPFSRGDLVPAGLEAESIVSGYHADNIAPALMGGFVLIRSTRPLDLQQLVLPPGQPLWFALVTPEFEAPTAEMRAALPKVVPMKSAVHNCAMGGALVAGILAGNARLVGEALGNDQLVEPIRGGLIPGFAHVKAAAAGAGAFGCTISGAGPTCVAVVDSPEAGSSVTLAMSDAFELAGLQTARMRVTKLDTIGARTIHI